MHVPCYCCCAPPRSPNKVAGVPQLILQDPSLVSIQLLLLLLLCALLLRLYPLCLRLLLLLLLLVVLLCNVANSGTLGVCACTQSI